MHWKTLDDWQHEVSVWGERTFGQSTAASVMAHMRREMKELTEEPDPLRRRVECADVLMLMLHLAHKEGWSLEMMLRCKFEINKRRQWGEPDADGVVEHVREEGRA